jgi:Dyp-type peroxidase family
MRRRPVEEPLLAGSEIQGDSLAGFRKDYVSLVFLEFDAARIADVKRWLSTLAPATLDAVHAFNAAFSVLRRRHGADPALSACWMNIGFTAQGLRKLVPADEVDQLGVAFNVGAHVRAATVGDPDDGTSGDPRTWVIGGPDNVPDAMLVFAADHDTTVATSVRALREQLDALAPGVSPVRVMYEQEGKTRPGAMRGHEHFGFKDGISQPGVRGRIDSPTHPLITPRVLDDRDPLSALFAAPGQPLLWPGEFVVGYPQNDQDDPLQSGAIAASPGWTKNGSFLVFRRLFQDVPAFLRFVEAGTAAVTAAGHFGLIDGERFGALCVGRWKSGTPVMRAPSHDDPRIAAASNGAANSFIYDEDTVPVKFARGTGLERDTLPAAKRDFDGVVCPLAAHLRKVNPRDETTDQGDAPRTLRHRILRRGIPYGDEYDPTRAGSDRADRGLLFIAYQSDIERQFEFLQRGWVNQEDAPRGGGGIDPIIGAHGLLRLCSDDGDVLDVPVPQRLVVTTGAAYLFVPAVSAIQDVLAKS